MHRSEIQLEEVPAPARLAPFAVAFGAEVYGRGAAGPGAQHGSSRMLLRPSGPEELATGRFVLLHDPTGSEAWNGRFRIVTYTRARLDDAMGNDHLVGSVAWTWFTESLADHGARHHSAGGTATRILSESYGTLADRPDGVDVELRASWTPETPEVRRHLEAWCEMVCTFAGLPPRPSGVTHLPQRRS